MMLKRFYKHNAAGELVDQDGNAIPLDEHGRPKEDAPPPAVDHVECWHTGIHPEQNFSEKVVKAAMAEGWVSIVKGKLVLHVVPEDLVYTVKRVPGRYELPDGGHEVLHHYECVLDAAAHEKYRFRGAGTVLRPAHLRSKENPHG